MSDSAAVISDNEKNNEIHNSNNRPQPSFSLKASMLRPSAFGMPAAIFVHLQFGSLLAQFN